MARTFHVDASVVTDLWTTNVAGTFSTHPADNGAVNQWDDVEHGSMSGEGTDGPIWRSSTPLMKLPCISFDGVTQRYAISDDVTGLDSALSSIISDTAYTVIAAFRVASVTTNNASPFDNEGLFADSGGYFGAYLKNTGSGYVVQVYNWDGGEDKIELPISLNTDYVLMMRHDSGTLYASLNGGSESSVASGTTEDLTFGLAIGSNPAAGKYLTGRIGEIDIYNSAVTGGTLATLLGTYITKWLTAAGAKAASHYYERIGRP